MVLEPLPRAVEVEEEAERHHGPGAPPRHRNHASVLQVVPHSEASIPGTARIHRVDDTSDALLAVDQPQRIRARRRIDDDRTDNNSLRRRFPFPHQQIPDRIPLVQRVEERDNVLVLPPEGPLKIGDPHAPRRH